MIVEGSMTAFAAAASSLQRTREEIRLEVSSPEPTRPSAPGGAESTRGRDAERVDDDRLFLLRLLVERLTGRPVRLVRQEAPEPVEIDAERLPRMVLEYRRVRVVEERLVFAAAGRVTTADGREIAFQVRFDLSRIELEAQSLRVVVGEDPLVLDFVEGGARAEGEGIAFDLDADGATDGRLPRVSGRGYLVFDRDGDGRVRDGRELFGPITGDGFAELARLDRDGNGWVDEADPDFGRLGLWQPGGRIRPLSEVGVGALHTGRVATPWRLDGGLAGLLRATGVWLGEDGRAGTISRIDLEI